MVAFRQHASIPLLEHVAHVRKRFLADLAARIAFLQAVESAVRAAPSTRLPPAMTSSNQPTDAENQGRDERSPQQDHHEHHADPPTAPHHVHAPGTPVLAIGRCGVCPGARHEGHHTTEAPPPASYVHHSPPLPDVSSLSTLLPQRL